MKTVTYEEMKKCVQAFTRTNQPPFDKDMVKNLIAKRTSDDRDYAPSSFLGNLALLQDRGVITSDVYADAVAQTVRSYTRSKDSAMEIFKRLTDYLERKLEISLPVDFPPIDSGNTFERLMFISKYLQDPDANISDLDDILWISSRTREKDIQKLRGRDDDPIKICGKKYIVPDFSISNDHVRDIASNPHPFFLTCNLTQVIVMLKGLKAMAGQKHLYGYAMQTATEIWEQLSDRARDRILFVMQELMPDEIEWYQNLGNLGKDTFWPEYRCSTYGYSAILECLKNGFSCCIEYETEEGSEILKDVMIRKYYEGVVVVEANGTSRTLETEKILRCARNTEEIF